MSLDYPISIRAIAHLELQLDRLSKSSPELLSPPPFKGTFLGNLARNEGGQGIQGYHRSRHHACWRCTGRYGSADVRGICSPCLLIAYPPSHKMLPKPSHYRLSGPFPLSFTFHRVIAFHLPCQWTALCHHPSDLRINLSPLLPSISTIPSTSFCTLSGGLITPIPTPFAFASAEVPLDIDRLDKLRLAM